MGRGLETKPSEPGARRPIHPLGASLDRSLHACERGITELSAAAPRLPGHREQNWTLTTQLSIGNLERQLRVRIIGHQQLTSNQIGFAGRQAADCLIAALMTD